MNTFVVNSEKSIALYIWVIDYENSINSQKDNLAVILFVFSGRVKAIE